MNIRIEDLRAGTRKKGGAALRAGQTVHVHRRIREGEKERVQLVKGLVISVRNPGSAAEAVTVRSMFGSFGVEQVFLVHSPFVERVEVIKEARVRRARLGFMRGRRGKSARLRERFFTEEERKNLERTADAEPTEEDLAEAVEAQQEAEKATEQVAEIATDKPEEKPSAPAEPAADASQQEEAEKSA